MSDVLNISYNNSNLLLSQLKDIEQKRIQILLSPISSKVELGMQFNAMIKRIKLSLFLSEIDSSEKEIIKTLNNQIILHQSIKKSSRGSGKIQKQILAYKGSIDYVRQYWLVESGIVDYATIAALYEIIADQKLKTPEKDVSLILDYLQASADSPIIQAAIAKLAFKSLSPASSEFEMLSTILSYLFLYKAGLDFRGFLVLERAWSPADRSASAKQDYLTQYENAVNRSSLTLWLEEFTKNLNDELGIVLSNIQDASMVNETYQKKSEKSLELTSRQVAILRLFEDPDVVITNRIIAKHFNISQITASRDLSKLASLGLLFVHGKGRSVRYTKV